MPLIQYKWIALSVTTVGTLMAGWLASFGGNWNFLTIFGALLLFPL